MKSKVTFSKKPPSSVAWGVHASPAGAVMIGVTPGKAVCRVSFAPGGKTANVLKKWKQEWPGTSFTKAEKETAPVARALSKTAAAPALCMVGTPFQQKVWKGLLAIPAGKTLSYGELAKKIKNPKAARAVGSACGANPVVFLVPCHRVIAHNGGLGGFGGGLPLKHALLKSEGVTGKKKRAR